VDTTPDEASRVIAIHAVAAHHLCRLILPSMRTLSRGDIVMLSSVATKLNGAYGAPYNMAKAALEALALTLAKEEVSHGIHVNIVAPGLVDTDMGRRLAMARSGTEDMRSLDASSPFGRVCQPEDVADVVRYLVSAGAGYVTGQRVTIDGGAND
jgi:3-oxoacyl-[acyl-carrier protein] reductase